MAGTSPIVRYPNANGDYTAWSLEGGSTTLECVATQDDSKFVRETVAGDRFSVRFPVTGDYEVPSDASNIQVKVYFRLKYYLGAAGMKPFLRLGTTNSDGTEQMAPVSYTTYSQVVSRPGGGNWTPSELNNASDFEAGGLLSTGGRGKNADCDLLYVEITFTQGAQPPTAPTDLECEHDASTDPYPSNASEAPVFSAKNSGDDSTHVTVQVCTNDDFADDSDPDYYLWDPGWLLSNCEDGERCALVEYDGGALSSHPPEGKYYWRIRFKNDGGDGAWSAVHQFSGINRSWQNTNYCMRHKLTFPSTHPELPAGTTVDFEFMTGYRRIVTSLGCFNEAIQASGGQMMCRTGGRTHIVFLGKTNLTTGKLPLYIVTYDHPTKTWGEPVILADAFTSYDTHDFPTIEATKDRHLHVFWTNHDSKMYYLRSKVPNVSGSLPGEPSSGNWINPATDESTPAEFSGWHTYPSPWVVRWGTNERLYVAARGGASDNYHWGFYYSDDGGETWSSRYYVVHDTSAGHYRVYLYGRRLDHGNNRLHLAFTLNHTGDVPQGVWYAYSDFDAETTQGFKDFYDAGGTKRGESTTSTSSTLPLDADTDADYRIVALDGTDGYFIEDLAILSDGRAYVLFEHKDPINAYAALTDIEGARWNPTTEEWDVIAITGGTIPKLRVRRSGVFAITDSAGALLLYYPCSGKDDAIDPENFAAEMIQLTSTDLGDTFTKKILSRNSSIGVPIVNGKYDLVDNVVEVVWVSGNDIFYYADRPYGKVLPSADDLRLYYGATEIDRLLDYTNMEVSRISFRLQDTVRQNRTAGPNDYYLLVGNQSETTSPKADPDEVWDILFDNFEEFDEADKLENVSDWDDESVFGYEGVIYRSPASHANKVAAGEAAVAWYGAGTNAATLVLDASTSEGSGIEHLYVSCYMWNETGSSNSNYGYLEIINNDTEAVFRAGGTLGGGGCYASYYDGIWHDVVANGFFLRNMHRIEIQLTADGASAWVDGHLVVTDCDVLTKGHQIRVLGVRDFFLDRVVCGRRIPGLGITIGPAEYRGFLMDATLQGSNTFSLHMDGTLSGEFTRMRGGLLPDHGRGSRCLSRKAIEVGEAGAGMARMSAAVQAVTSGRAISQLECRRSIVLVGALSVEAGSRLLAQGSASLDVSGLSSAQGALSVEPRERATMRGGLHVEPSAAGGLSILLPLDLGLAFEGQAAPVVDWANGVLLAATMRFERVAPVVVSLAAHVYLAQSITTAGKTLMEWLQSPSVSVRTILAVVATLTTKGDLRLEGLAHITARNHVSLDLGQGLQQDACLPVEHPEGSATRVIIPLTVSEDVINRAGVEMEASRAASAPGRVQAERGSADTAGARGGIDLGAGVSLTVPIPLEWRGALVMSLAGRIPVEWSGWTAYRTPAQAERGSGGLASCAVMADISGCMQVRESISLETVSQSSVVMAARMEALRAVSAILTALQDIAERSAGHHSLLSERLATARARVALAIETQGIASIAAFGRIPVDWTTAVVTGGGLALEYGTALRTAALLGVDHGAGTGAVAGSRLDLPSMASLIHRVSLETLSRASGALRVPVEYGAFSVDDVRVHLERSIGAAAAAPLPLDLQGTDVIRVAGRMPLSWAATLEQRSRIAVEHQSRVSIRHGRVLLDTGSAGSATSQVMAEIGAACDAVALVMAEALESVGATANIHIEWIAPGRAGLRTYVEFGVGQVFTSCVPVETLRSLSAAVPINAEWIGLQITLLTLTQAQIMLAGLPFGLILLPPLEDAQIALPGPASGSLLFPQVGGAIDQGRRAGRRRDVAAIDVPDITQAKIIGGD